MAVRANFVLTDEEKDFATENHNLIYRFLQRYGLDIGDWYDTVAIGYLYAVHTWFTRPDLHKYKFSTIANKRMSSCFGKELRNTRAAKRAPRSSMLSLDAKSDPTNTCTTAAGLDNLIPSKEDLCSDVISKVYTENFIKALSPEDLHLISLRYRRLSQNEIAHELGVSQSCVSERIARIVKKYREAASA